MCIFINMIGYLFIDELDKVYITRQITDRFFMMENVHHSNTAFPVIGFILIIIALTIDKLIVYSECGYTNTAFFFAGIMEQ